MTPSDLERTREKHGEIMRTAFVQVDVASMLFTISQTLDAILQHMADVEGELNLERSHGRRIEERVDAGQT